LTITAISGSTKLLADKLPALNHKEFRLYWLGQSVSLLGTWMQNVGLAWLVLTMTASPFRLGLLEAVRFLPVTLFSLFAGVIIDKYPKRRLLIITQTVAMLLSFVLSALVFTDAARYWHILILALVLGCANTIDMPARHSFTVELTGKEDLMNAVALSSVTFNLARIVGPAVGALVLAYAGAGWCFLLNGISFLAVIVSLLRIKARPYVRPRAGDSNPWQEIKDGLRYVATDKRLLQPLILFVILGIFAFNHEILVPVFTRNVLGQNEKVYGLLISALGSGSLLGALVLSWHSRVGPKPQALLGSAAAVSMLLVCLGCSRDYYMTAVCLILSGASIVWFTTTANSLLQIAARDEYRGRVMSLHTLVNSGTAPLGYLFAGAVAGRLGAGTAYWLSGGISLVLLAIFTFRNLYPLTVRQPR